MARPQPWDSGRSTHRIPLVGTDDTMGTVHRFVASPLQFPCAVSIEGESCSQQATCRFFRPCALVQSKACKRAPRSAKWRGATPSQPPSHAIFVSLGTQISKHRNAQIAYFATVPRAHGERRLGTVAASAAHLQSKHAHLYLLSTT